MCFRENLNVQLLHKLTKNYIIVCYDGGGLRFFQRYRSEPVTNHRYCMYFTYHEIIIMTVHAINQPSSGVHLCMTSEIITSLDIVILKLILVIILIRLPSQSCVNVRTMHSINQPSSGVRMTSEIITSLDSDFKAALHTYV